MNIPDLLKQKEEELQRVQRELEALRIVARLLDDVDGASENAPGVTPISTASATPRVQRENVHSFADASGRQFP